MTPLETVIEEIAKYEHPHFQFSATPSGDGVELCIESRIPGAYPPAYRITFSERDLTSRQFPWTFQKLLYGCLTDYVVELFSKNPMTS